MAKEIPPEGVIIRAENGDVIRYDETGLVLRLSDKVIADIDSTPAKGDIGQICPCFTHQIAKARILQ